MSNHLTDSFMLTGTRDSEIYLDCHMCHWFEEITSAHRNLSDVVRMAEEHMKERHKPTVEGAVLYEDVVIQGRQERRYIGG